MRARGATLDCKNDLLPRLPALSAAPATLGDVAVPKPPQGLTAAEAQARLKSSGPNSMPDTALHPLKMAFAKFWAPVPWMLEAAIGLELILGKYVEAAIIALLLIFNALLGFFQESRAQATLAALKSRLALNASVRRDNVWKTVPAAELVQGDVVKLSLGAVVAADVRISTGEVLLDQSMLTGESVPIEAGAGVQTFAGALVRRGEAVAEVTATGIRTKFGLSRGTKSGRLQWGHYSFDGGLRLFPENAGGRDHSAGADRHSRLHPGSSSRDVHPGFRARRAGAGQAGRAADPPVGGR